jgi:hypothetical protein
VGSPIWPPLGLDECYNQKGCKLRAVPGATLWRMISERRSVKFMENPRKSDDDVNVKMMRESDDDAKYECV